MLDCSLGHGGDFHPKMAAPRLLLPWLAVTELQFFNVPESPGHSMFRKMSLVPASPIESDNHSCWPGTNNVLYMNDVFTLSLFSSFFSLYDNKNRRRFASIRTLLMFRFHGALVIMLFLNKPNPSFHYAR